MALDHVTLDDKYDLDEEPDLRHRLPGAGAALPDAEGARPPRRAEHRGLRHRLSRLAARRARPAVPARAEDPAPQRHRLPARHQRGARRHRGVGHAAGRAARRGQVRRRVRHVVRQGPRRRPLRRRVPPRQFRRHLEARRRARADGRRPHRGVLHHRAPVGIPFRRPDDPDPQSGGRAGDPRLRPLRLGDVALHRRLGGAQVHARDGGDHGRGRRQPRPREDRHARRLRDAGGRAQHPPRRHHPRAWRRGSPTTSATPCSPSCAPTSSTASSPRAGAIRRSASSRSASPISTCARRSTSSASTRCAPTTSGCASTRSRCPWPLEPARAGGVRARAST